MENDKKFLIGISFIVIIVTIFFLKLFIFRSTEKVGRKSVTEKSNIMLKEKPGDKPEKLLEENSTETVKPLDITLAESDDVIRNLLSGEIKDPRFNKILNFNDIIMRFTAAVDNISRGNSPAKNLDFLEPFPSFKPGSKKGVLYLSETSFKRYDKYIKIFCEFDSAAMIKIFRLSKKLIDKAWSRLGYSGTEFEDTLFEAFNVLYHTPVPGRLPPEKLNKKIFTYKFSRDKFERLNNAQKHFIRLGPANMIKVKSKIKELSGLLGFKLE